MTSKISTTAKTAASAAVTEERAKYACEPLMSAKESAPILNVSPTKLKRMAQSGEIPAIRIGNRWKFRASWLDEWLNSRVPSSRHPRPASCTQEVQ